LKLVTSVKEAVYLVVAPYTGAWIETRKALKLVPNTPGSPLHGGVD